MDQIWTGLQWFDSRKFPFIEVKRGASDVIHSSEDNATTKGVTISVLMVAEEHINERRDGCQRDNRTRPHRHRDKNIYS